jgi:ankyrin repeat protein
MSILSLPDDPSLEHLKKQAKALHHAMQSGDADAMARLRVSHPRADEITEPSLSDAQLTLAREYGFASWPRLVERVSAIEQFAWSVPAQRADESEADAFIRLACLNFTSDHASRHQQARQMFARNPALATQSIYAAAVVGDVPAVERFMAEDQTLVNKRGGVYGWPPLLYASYARLNSTEPEHSTLRVAELLLSQGADPNAGMLWGGRYPFTALTGAFGEGEAGPANQPRHPQSIELATLLLEAGANANDRQALYNRHFLPDNSHFEVLFKYGLGNEPAGPWFERLGGHYFIDDLRLMLVEELWMAARKGYFSRVKLLVAHGADVNGKGPRDGRSVYEAAMLCGQREVAEYLLAHGATKVALKPAEAFAAACLAGDGDAAAQLLASHPTLVGDLGEAGQAKLLGEAAGGGRLEGIRLMHGLGFNVNAMGRNTALHEAAWSGRLEAVKLLVALGADPTRREPTYHATAIGWAAHNQQQAVVAYLLPLADIFDAATHGSVARVEALLAADASLIHAHSPTGKTPLALAVASGQSAVADLLRRYGATDGM